ncbi:MAG: hypothetical protein PHC56_09495 [Herbinix sp.]|nr:hypothetical protein [Herbinix sp.]
MNNKFSDEQIRFMYSDKEFLTFVNQYFSSFNTCILESNLLLDNNYFNEKNIDVFLRIILANIDNLRKYISHVERNLSFSYKEVSKTFIGEIQGRLRINEYVHHKSKVRMPREYPCIVNTKTYVTPENVYVIYIIEYVIELLTELKKYLLYKNNKVSITEIFSEIQLLDEHTKAFNVFTKKGYFLECYKELSLIKNVYKNDFPREKYNLVMNRMRKGKIKNSKSYQSVFDWFAMFKKGSLIFIDETNMDLLRYSDDFSNKLFELWCLYSLKETFITEFKFELIEANDIMEASKGYIFKIRPVTGGTLEIYYQKGNELYWQKNSELIWKYKKGSKEQGLVGIPDISVKYTTIRESLVMIDIKNRIRSAGSNSEEIYKMIGYFTNFKRAFEERYSNDVKKQAALVFRNDVTSFEENLESDDGYRLKALSVSPSNNDLLNRNQFKILCKYILDMQGINGTTAAIIGSYSKNSKTILDQTTIDNEDEEDVAYRISEQNHTVISSMFSFGDLSDSLQSYYKRIEKNYFPHVWADIDEKAKGILGMAECLFDGVTPCVTADYAPICLEYCRALEVEINELIIRPFRNSHNINSLSTRNKYYEKMKQNRDMTLGECCFFFEKCNHPRFPMTELKNYIQQNVKSSITCLNQGKDIIKNINEQIRRKAAHTNIMTYEELINSRQVIFGIGNPNLFYILLDKR